jgi:hypothetical protein
VVMARDQVVEVTVLEVTVLEVVTALRVLAA